jgi:glucose-6-phosphate dehydrogenase assembly protein OpcA
VSAAASTLGGAWSGEDTSPAEVEAALGRLLARRHAEEGRFNPARVLNLVAVVDHERREEVVERLEGVGRYHPSRTVVCAVEPGRRALDATATLTCQLPSEPGGVALCRERIELALGETTLPGLASIVDPLLVPDLETLAWSPHGHAGALDALGGLAHSVLYDSSEPSASRAGLTRARELAARAHVVDLAWLRAAPWRERLAALFDPPEWRPALREITALEVRHHPRSASSALLLVGWLASRLGWEARTLGREPRGLGGSAGRGTDQVRLHLTEEPELAAPGLGGVSLEARSGLALRLERGSGGLSAWRRSADGEEGSWTILGASRGEAGILGEGIRQALLRSSLYRPALERAVEMVP